MRTTICTLQFLSISVLLLLNTSLYAQQLSFDGKDDYAFVAASKGLPISGKQDFTFEFFINPGESPKGGMALLSIHDGKSGIVCAINQNGIPYLLIDNKYYQSERVDIPKGCYHLVFMRKGGELLTVINGRYYGMGGNNTYLANNSDIYIGDSPFTSEGHYHGAIEEIRLWNTYRTEGELEEYRKNCLYGNHEGLMAHWNIKETSGQYANDMVANRHARWGDQSITDAADPSLIESNCYIEANCCDLIADFEVEGSEDHYTFINQSNGGVYTWYIDGQVISTTTDLNHIFQTPGTYQITLEAKTKNGCRSKKTIEITVDFHNEIEFCDGFTKTYNDPAPYNFENLYFDRFGNRYSANELSVPGGQTTANQVQLQSLKSLAVTSCDCLTDFGISTGKFELYFEDCELNTASGFDDQTPSAGGSTLGRDRRRTICQVYADLNSTILQNAATCGMPADNVRVRIMPSQANGYYADGSNLAPLPVTVGGAASAFTTYGPKEGIVEVMPWIVLNTGSDQQFNYGSQLYHGFLRINFTSFTNTWQTDHTVPVASNAVDLYSVALHETMHMLGMGSFLNYDGLAWYSRLTGNFNGGYSRWDSHMKKAAGNVDVLTPFTPYDYILNPLLTLPADLLNSCNGTDLWIGDHQAPLYSGTSANYSPGSSLSHLDESCTGASYVLNPTIAPGDDKRTISTTELQLFADLGYQVSGYSNCVVAGVDDFYGNCAKTFVVSSCPGSSLTITTADLIANDINATGATNVELISTSGVLQTVTGGSNNSDYILTPAVNNSGDYLIRYQPVGCVAQTGNVTYAIVEVRPCQSCEFTDVNQAQAGNSFIVDNGPNCGVTPSSGKCVDCGFNKNPDNLICNPEFCADNSNLILDYSHFDCSGSAVTELPGWYRAAYTPGYVAPTINNSVSSSQRDFPSAMHPNSGYMHNANFGFVESMYTNVNINAGSRYLFSTYGQSVSRTFGGNAELQVLMLSANFNVDTEFSCANSLNNLPIIYPSNYLPVLYWNMTEHYFPSGTSNTQPFDRNGSYLNVPSGFPGAYLYFTNRRLNGTSAQVNLFVDQVELVEDNFTAGDDQSLTCGLTVDLGGQEFAMLSDVRVQYTWTDQTSGSVIADYWVERELNGNLIVFDLINTVALTQIPAISVAPGATTTYRLTRTFIPDTDGTFGGLPVSTFNGIPTTDDVIVNVPTTPIANPAFTHTINCNAVSFVSDPASVGSQFSHSWDINNDGIWDYFTENPTHPYGVNGTFQVVHEVSNGCGTFTTTQPVTITGNTLSLDVIASSNGPFTAGSTFTADVIVTNIGTVPVTNVTVDAPVNALSAGLSYTFSPVTITSLNPGQSQTITIPVSVTGTCGESFICAEITSADNACLIPPVCSNPLIIQSDTPLDQALQINSVITNTYSAPFVVGGLVEFDVTVTNQSSSSLSNIDLNYFPSGLDLQTAAPSVFTLPAGGSSTFTVTGRVQDCLDFAFNAEIASAANTCPGPSPSTAISGQVTPYSINVVTSDQVCQGTNGVVATVEITNPSSQPISDVTILPTGSSNLFSNLSGNLSNLTLAANGTTTATFTYEVANQTGSAFICADIASIGVGSNQINYSCANTLVCTPVNVWDNPVTVTISSSPPDGTHRCIYQNPLINYTVEITNNLPIAQNNLPVNTIFNGLAYTYGQTIPASISLPANGSVSYSFGASAQIPAGSADLTVEVITGIPGCNVSSASTSHPIFYTVNDVLTSTSVVATPGPYVYGQTIAFDVTVNNISPYQINDIELNGVDPSFANSLGNISTVPLFDLAPGASTVQTITATLTNCNIWEFFAQITQTGSTCFGNLISNRLDGTIDDLSLTVSPIGFTCDGSGNTINVQISNPAGTTINNVFLNVSGSQVNTLFPGSLGNFGPVSLNPGVNNVSIPITAASGVSGTANICVEIDRIGGIPYDNCVNTNVCQNAVVGELIETFTYTIPLNITSACPGQFVNFVTGVINKHSTPITVTYNNSLTGITLFNSQAMSGSLTVNPGSSQTLTYVTQISNTATVADFQTSFNTGAFADCSGVSNFNDQIQLSINPTLSQALDISAVLTSTYPSPHVVGGFVEFDVTVTNNSAILIDDIDVGFSASGLTGLSANPATFSLAANAATTFTVSGLVTDCNIFDLTAQVLGATGTCGGTGNSDVVSGVVTPYGISITSPELACSGSTSLLASAVINNPSSQTINDVNLSALSGSTLFQNVSAISPVNLQPGNNTVSFTFDSNGNNGTENVCISINSIGTGVNSIPYICSNTACDLTEITANPLQVTLTSLPVDGSSICVDQNAVIDYTLTITNPTAVDISGINITSVLNGITLNGGQSIPAATSVIAGSTQTFQFSGTASANAGSANLQVDVNSNILGCANASVSTNHILLNDLTNVLGVNAVQIGSGPFALGDPITYQVTVTNLSASPVNNINLAYQHSGLLNTSLSPSAFNIAAGASSTYNVSALVDDCQQVIFTANVLSADQVCINNYPTATVNTAITPYSVQLNGPALTCAGSSANFTVDVFHPGLATISNVNIVLTGAAGFGNSTVSQQVSLQPGTNTFIFPMTAVSGFNGNTNVCAEITQIGNTPYNCNVPLACHSVTITDQPLAISVQQSGSGLLCNNGMTSFTVTLTNQTNNALNGIDLSLSGPAGISSANLPSGVNLSAGGSNTFSFDVSVNGGLNSLGFCLDVTNIASLSCFQPNSASACVSNIAVNNLSLPIEIEDAITGPSGNLSFEAIYDMTLDDDGNMYAVGVMRDAQATVNGAGSNTFTATNNCSIGMNPFVMKYDNNGVSWFKTIDACGVATAVDVDASGHVFVALNTFGDLDFAGSTQTGAGWFDFAILRYDGAGNELMFKAEGGDGMDYVADLKVNSGKIVVTGATGDIPPAIQPAGYNNQYSIAGQTFTYHQYTYQQNNTSIGDGFTASYNYNASAISNNWVDVIAAPVIPNKLAVATGGNVFVIGVALETFAFPHILPGGGGQIAVNSQLAGGIPAATSQPNVNIDIDAFIISYDNAGNNRWGRLYGSTALDYPESVANSGGNNNSGSAFHQTDIRLSESGQLYAALQSQATLTGAPVAGSTLSFQTEMGTHLVNINPVDGSIGANEWSVPAALPVTTTHTSVVGGTTYTHTLVGNTVSHPNIAIDDQDNVFLAATYYLADYIHQSVDFYSTAGGPAPLTLAAGTLDELGGVIEKFDSNGNFQWAEANRSWMPYLGGYNPNFTPGNNPLRTLDLEVNNCGLYQTTLLDGTYNVGGVTYEGAPYDAFIFRIREVAGGLVYGRTESNSAPIQDLITENEEVDFTVYPNPNRGNFKINVSGSKIKENSKIMIYHMNGTLINSIVVNNPMQIELDFTGRSSGMYFIRMINGNEVITKSVVVQR